MFSGMKKSEVVLQGTAWQDLEDSASLHVEVEECSQTVAKYGGRGAQKRAKVECSAEAQRRKT
jgi:hypothetical protein